MNYLLDTCVISEYIKRKPNNKVINWLDEQEEDSLFISILTIAELRKGIVKIETSQSQRYKKLNNWLNKVEKRFKNRILDLNPEILIEWAILCGKSEAKGKKLPIIDSLISTVAIKNNLILVTRNLADFKFSKVDIINPWD